ncbi:RNA 2',3'-cyclic phosphodiesterase [Sphingomonas sp. LY160]|uniref:RNA 2',3'-cyclic phosphodiesterase n=1 Tax=Sphingomonas sp. LY160 TaxID=3095342 RepID=UPI002ADEF330|nr:RNA 2',3'-cyclic phosphodiesterase [Sphingomonas sp. LY160]MEA1073231.1 RNA 2',3'-cyclic phosphodiesterase [Sphingomonas sp. LY160]
MGRDVHSRERNRVHRLFVALPLQQNIREGLIDTMEGLPSVNWQPEDQLHLTLRFVGEVERPVAEDLAVALSGLTSPAFDISISGVNRFDHQSRGLLWAAVQPREPIVTLAGKIERICQRIGLPPERRAYHPHITLGRWNRFPGSDLDRFLARHATLRSDPFRIDRFTLFESHLGHAGAHHEVIADFPLA